MNDILEKTRRLSTTFLPLNACRVRRQWSFIRGLGKYDLPVPRLTFSVRLSLATAARALVKAACQAGETFAVGKAGPELVVVVVEVVEVDEVVVEVVDPPPPVPPGRHCQYQSLTTVHVAPLTHVVPPFQPMPPH